MQTINFIMSRNSSFALSKICKLILLCTFVLQNDATVKERPQYHKRGALLGISDLACETF